MKDIYLIMWAEIGCIFMVILLTLDLYTNLHFIFNIPLYIFSIFIGVCFIVFIYKDFKMTNSFKQCLNVPAK